MNLEAAHQEGKPGNLAPTISSDEARTRNAAMFGVIQVTNSNIILFILSENVILANFVRVPQRNNNLLYKFSNLEVVGRERSP